MSSALPVVSGRQAIRVLSKAGFAEVSRKGSHVKLRSDAGRTVIVPDHRELARGALASMLRQAGLSVHQFVDMAVTTGRSGATRATPIARDDAYGREMTRSENRL